MMLINGLRDDKKAIFATGVQEYNLWPLVVAVIVISFILYKLLARTLNTAVWVPRKNVKKIIMGSILLLPVFFIFVRFGGAFNYDSGIHWENAGRTKSDLLNEAILDDGQAIYRVYAEYDRMNQVEKFDLNKDKLREAIGILGGNQDAATLEQAFQHKAAGGRLAHEPQEIVLIFGENNAKWPFLERYQALNLVPYEGKMEHSEKAISFNAFLAGGGGTMPSLKVLLTGLPDNGLADNYEPETYKTKFATGVGNTMKKLGYKTVFWYGGLGSWQSVKKFALAQGFDEFHGGEDITNLKDGAWGIRDEELFAAMQAYIAKEKSQDTGTKTFHFVLTTSNHPPYGIDVDGKGFQRAAVRTKLPQSISKDENILTQIGHIWYADLTMGQFVESVKAAYPDALFIITGDHAERFSFATQEDAQALFGVPAIFYGEGIKKAWITPQMVGSHIQIIPTIVELVAPKDFIYSSIRPNLFTKDDIAFNQKLWARQGKMGLLPELAKTDKIHDMVHAGAVVSAWRLKKGNEIR